MKHKKSKQIPAHPARLSFSAVTWQDTLGVALLALLIRLLTSLSLFLVPSYLPAFDKSADLVLPLRDRWVQGFLRWDALYFLDIAQRGYTLEQHLAFMPALPLLMRLGGVVVDRDLEPSAKSMVVASSILANVAAVMAAALFHRLSSRVLRSRRLANTASILFCLSPSPATLSSPYNEPFFAAASYAGMLLVEKDQGFLAACAFAAATSFRANGILNAGFFVWHFLLRPWPRIRPSSIARAVLGCLIICSPFILVQYWAYGLYCRKLFTARPWCANRIPMVYTFVQDHYWDVGLFRYWTWNQLPLFFLSAPVLSMAFRASWSFYKAHGIDSLRASAPFLLLKSKKIPSVKVSSGFTFNLALIPYVHLHTALTCLLLFASHVQICLRLAPTMPVIYWYAAERFHSNRERWWINYCALWAPLSVVLWAGFYPPA